MYRRLTYVMFPILLIALLGVGVWGYQEHQDKNAVLIKAENQYQRAFHDLSFHVDRLHTELGNTLAVNSASTDTYKKGLINIWRITSEAQSEINQLPLTLLPFNQTEELLANTAKFAYQTAVRDLTKQPMSEEERGTLNALYTHSKEMTEQLRDVQSKVLQNNLRWMDVETALATQKEPYDNMIIDGFMTVNKQVAQYKDVNFGPTTAEIFQNRDMKVLGATDASPEEIKMKAAQFLGTDGAGLNVTENGAGTEYNTYSVTGPKQGTNDGIHLDYSKKGGELLFYSSSRDVPSKQIDVRRARDIAAEFLDTHGYANMTMVSADEYNNVVNATFAERVQDVVNLIEKVSVKVALDNGEILGLQASDFVFEHKVNRTAAQPKLSAEEARKSLNPSFEVADEKRVLIRNDLNEEVQCYQFSGKINGGTYRIYINADNGKEEKIENIKQTAA